jgi:hypothetical protein
MIQSRVCGWNVGVQWREERGDRVASGLAEATRKHDVLQVGLFMVANKKEAVEITGVAFMGAKVRQRDLAIRSEETFSEKEL